MRRSLSRRRLLAAAAPGLLAGCLVESDESAGDADRESAGEGESEETESDSEETEGESEETDESTAEQSDDGSVSDEVGPDGSGLVVASADVLDVTDDGGETTVDARLTVENAGRFAYGTVELRVDAYASRPSSSDREAVGFGYVTERFPSDSRFDDGTRRFDVSIAFSSRETSVRSDPGWYEVDAAVRRAEPV
ncbi:hypothetical protein U4E84_14825 [Halorubrum sp. AD140]|uniref:hypothetical protein n=1 Tax=Halorubrum sp. AD140 TaxID=3050073 RepID=UPI002ACC88C2|nr:hypothetical protein [Halorubrum sp. AD140]MDZ5812620.1 hypothetical protein [Halorubrum sp. AD140]